MKDNSITFATSTLSALEFSVQSNILDKDFLEGLLESSRGGRLKEELLYWELRTALKWLSYENIISDSSNYEFETLGSRLGEILKNSSINFLGLGIGSGKKESRLIHHMLVGREDKQIHFYPVDISAPLLGLSISNLSKDDSTNKVLRTKGIWGDFRNISRLNFVYDSPGFKTVFCLFGNTLGNYVESEILNEIERASKIDDLVVIEVNRYTDRRIEAYDKYRKDAYKEFIVEPLRSFGIAPKITNLEFQKERSKTSVVTNSFRVAAVYRFDESEMKTRRKDSSRIVLTVTTHYEMMGLISYVTSLHRFELIEDFPSKDSFMLIFRRR